MKKSRISWLLLALTIMTFASFAVKKNATKKPAIDLTNYYWFDANTNYLGRQNTIDNEKALTDFDQSMSNPKTLQEKGYTPANVNQGANPPSPISPTSPDKKLYTHP